MVTSPSAGATSSAGVAAGGSTSDTAAESSASDAADVVSAPGSSGETDSETAGSSDGAFGTDGSGEVASTTDGAADNASDPGRAGEVPAQTDDTETVAAGSAGDTPGSADAAPQDESPTEQGEAETASDESGEVTASEPSDAEQSEEPTTDETTSTDEPVAAADGCPAGQWPSADPAVAGPFEVVMEEEVGPEAGEPEEDGSIPRFTLFRPENMDESGLCHPLITWGNGTGSTPNLYGGLLRHLASHGFVIIGSNSTNVARGEPRPMNVGIDWVVEQNEDASSVLYQRIDTAHIGATGHSQGAMATSQASGDERIVTSLPIEGANVQRDLHGPAMFFCGGEDDVVGCDGAVRALDAVTTLPAMYANYLTVDHGSWLTFAGNTRTDVEIAITAWMRVHLMEDAELRPWFYGESCELCTNSAWEIERKNMDE
jgi:hypothetical protein